MTWLRVALLMMTAALFLNSCATLIHDIPLCAPYPLDSNGKGTGGHCDDFLTSNPQRLTQAEWVALQKTWVVTQCTSDQAAVWLKGEIEKLCSMTTCTYQQAQQIKVITDHVDRTFSSNRDALAELLNLVTIP